MGDGATSSASLGASAGPTDDADAAGVLFVCTHNAVRSPMAGALYRHLAGDGPVLTAGVFPGAPVDPFAAEAMDEIGLDISAHAPQTLSDIEAQGGDVAAFDAVIALSPLAAERAREFGGPTAQVEIWEATDPSQAEDDPEARREAFRALREELAERIKGRFPPRRCKRG